MMRRQDETSAGDQVPRANGDRFQPGAGDTAEPDPGELTPPDSQPAVTAADVTAVPSDDVPAAGPGYRGVPPAEAEWVAGTRGPGPAPTASGQPDPPTPAAPSETSAAAEPFARSGTSAQTGREQSAGPAPGRLGAGSDAGAPLVPDQGLLRERWLQIQSGFIDDPRGSVTEAAGFVSEITGTLMTAVQDRERTLRGTWESGGSTDTEDLRNALRDYRTFFDLLTRL